MNAISKRFSAGRIFEGDKVIWMVLFFLCVISVMEVYSASSNMTYKTGNYWRPILQHATYMAGGVLLTLVVHKMPCRLFKLISAIGLPISILMLINALFEEKVNNASRWLELGGITFQPSEFAKGALVVAISIILSSMREEITSRLNAFKWILIFTVIICSLIAPENLSTAAMTFLVVLMMMFIGRMPWKPMGALIGVIVISGALAFSFLKFSSPETLKTVGNLPGMHRVPTWANRFKSHAEEEKSMKLMLSENPQVTHAKIAIATCNVIGRGPGNSVERDFLPQSFSDFIYAIVIEELGLLGGAFVMFLYIVILFRAARIASKCERGFPAFLVMGLALMLVTQALVNMAVAVGAFPVTGQPLPLISKGGTSTMINCVYLGMILSVSRSAKKRKENDSEIENNDIKTEVILNNNK